MTHRSRSSMRCARLRATVSDDQSHPPPKIRAIGSERLSLAFAAPAIQDLLHPGTQVARSDDMASEFPRHRATLRVLLLLALAADAAAAHGEEIPPAAVGAPGGDRSERYRNRVARSRTIHDTEPD